MVREKGPIVDDLDGWEVITLTEETDDVVVYEALG